jgi:Holin of 3TMs, for gene-transfer release
MGMIGRLLAGGAARQVGEAVGDVAEVFVGNQAEREAADSERYLAAVGEFNAEFARAAVGPFDGFVNSLNRLPRPLMTLGTLALFVYAMLAPAGFSTRMQGLALVPEPLWWLLGAIVSFYFGARELHHQRMRSLSLPRLAANAITARAKPEPAAAPVSGTRADAPAPTAVSFAAPVARSRTATAAAGSSDPDFNAAVDEWRSLRP